MATLLRRAASLAAIAAILACGARAESDQWKLKLSGHTRLMHEGYNGLEFGFGEVDDDDWLHQRVQTMVTLSHGEILSFASELTWGRMYAKKAELSPPDQDEPDFLQLFIKARAPLGSDFLEFQLGRQTLKYGSGRLLADRDGTNQRLAHDAARISWQRGKDTRVDVFVASPVKVYPEEFDNHADAYDFLLWSIYGVFPLGKGHFADLYYIGIRDRGTIFAENGGTETRHTVGIRNWKTDGPFTYNTELIAQFGEVKKREIVAGAVSIEVARAFQNLPFKPRLGLRADMISGGSDSSSVHTFHPLFQRNDYFNEGGFLAPSNLWNLNPLLRLNLQKNLQLSLGVGFQWLFSTRDAIYGPPLQPLAQPLPGGPRYLGTAYNAALEWTVGENASLSIGFTHHDAGRAITAVGGEDATYLSTSLRILF